MFIFDKSKILFSTVFPETSLVPTFGFIVVVVVLSVFGTYVCRKTNVPKSYFLVPFFLFVSVGFIFFYFFGPYFPVSDSRFYELQGIRVRNFLLNVNSDLQLVAWKQAWPFVIGFVYLIFGVSPLVVIAINSALGGITVLLLTKTTALLSNSAPNRIAMFLFLLNPMVIIAVPSLSREAIFWASTALYCYGLALLLRNVDIKTILILSLGAISMLVFRPTLAAFVIGFSCLALSSVALVTAKTGKNSLHKWLGPKKIKIFSSLVFVFTLAVLFVALYLFRGTDAPTISQTRKALSDSATSSFKFQISHIGPLDQSLFGSVIDSIWVGLQSFPRIFFGPFFEDQISSTLLLFLEANLFIWIIVWSFATYHFWKVPSQRLLSGVNLLISLMVAFLFSMILSNYGILVRFKVIPLIFLIPFASMGISLFSLPQWLFKILNPTRPYKIRK